jgi:hypothetical protein
MLRVIERRFWRHTSGATASLYGAVPWHTSTEAADWEIVAEGYTVQDSETGTIGHPGLATRSREAVEAFAERENARRARIRTEQAMRLSAMTVAIDWRTEKSADGRRRYRSGRGFAIECHGHGYACVSEDGTEPDEEWPVFGKLQKARAWCEAMIRSRRQDALLDAPDGAEVAPAD